MSYEVMGPVIQVFVSLENNSPIKGPNESDVKLSDVETS